LYQNDSAGKQFAWQSERRKGRGAASNQLHNKVAARNQCAREREGSQESVCDRGQSGIRIGIGIQSVCDESERTAGNQCVRAARNQPEISADPKPEVCAGARDQERGQP
jgi:hypothetical protein